MNKKFKILSVLFAALMLTTACEAGGSIKYGTSDKPLSVSEFVTNLGKLEENTLSEKEMYVKGTVATSTFKTSFGTYDITFVSDEVVSISSAMLGAGLSAPAAGNKICVKGYGSRVESISNEGTVTAYQMTYCTVNNEPYNPTIYSIDGLNDSPLDPIITPVNPGVSNSMGTLDNPLTLDQFKTACAALADGAYSTSRGYVQGAVVSLTYDSGHNSYDIYFDEAKTMKGYSVQLNGFAAPSVGDTVVIYGYFQNYVDKNGVRTYEVAYHNGEKVSPVISKVNGVVANNPEGTITQPDEKTPVDIGYPEGDLSSPVQSGVAYKISFATVGQREYVIEGSEQVWSCAYYSIDNYVADAPTGPAGYSDPARFYKNTSFELKSTCGLNIDKIIFEVDPSKGATALSDAFPKGTYDSTTCLFVTDEIDLSVVSFIISAQFRLNAIYVIFE